MGRYEEVKGNLVTQARDGEFDVIVHGCNCFCQMGAGIAPLMAQWFGVDKYPLEWPKEKGDFNKLGQIDYGVAYVKKGEVPRTYPHNKDKVNVTLEREGFRRLIPVNAYTQYGFGRNHKGGTPQPLDYIALTMCMRKINHTFKGKHIALPLIGCGLAGGDWDVVSDIIRDQLKDCNVTIIHWDGTEVENINPKGNGG